MIGVLLDILCLATVVGACPPPAPPLCDRILYQGQCADIDTPLCGVGQRLYLSPEGEGYCDCDEVRDEGKVLQFTPPRYRQSPCTYLKGWLKRDGICYQNLTTAFCGENNILNILSTGGHSCIENPCLDDDGLLYLPHQ